MFRALITALAASLLSVATIAAVDPFDSARYHIQTKQNEDALRLIDSGNVDVNMQTEEGYSLLHYAAEAGNLEMVKALLARGADPALKAKTGTTPYQMAVGTMVQAEIRKAMTKRVAVVPPPRSRAPVADARPKLGATPGGNGMCSMVRAEQINDERSAAMRPWLKAKDAIWYNHPDQLTGLLDDCVDANQKDQYGWTLLHAAADRNRVEHARILLEHGASRNIRNRDGKTPAQLATSPEMRALLGASTPSATPAKSQREVECRQKYEADAALSSDSTGKIRAMRRWQQCLKTGLYW